jgi:hypothetical protein
MKVKIGHKVYDASEQPILLILSPTDKANIAAMHPHAIHYAAFPQGTTYREFRAFVGGVVDGHEGLIDPSIWATEEDPPR